MSVMYITENDKNGKARYYRVTDGKKKVISRFEYEANAEINANKTEIIGEEVQTNDCQITLADDFECNVKESSIKETYEKSGIDILDVARGVLAETKIADWKSLSYKAKASATQIKYRRCVVCTLTRNNDSVLIEFLGTTDKRRKKTHSLEYTLDFWNELLTSDGNDNFCDVEWNVIKSEICSQIIYIDNLWKSIEPAFNNAS